MSSGGISGFGSNLLFIENELNEKIIEEAKEKIDAHFNEEEAKLKKKETALKIFQEKNAAAVEKELKKKNDLLNEQTYVFEKKLKDMQDAFAAKQPVPKKKYSQTSPPKTTTDIVGFKKFSLESLSPEKSSKNPTAFGSNFGKDFGKKKP